MCINMRVRVLACALEPSKDLLHLTASALMSQTMMLLSLEVEASLVPSREKEMLSTCLVFNFVCVYGRMFWITPCAHTHNTHIHIYTHTHTYTHIHTHTHTYTHLIAMGRQHLTLCVCVCVCVCVCSLVKVVLVYVFVWCVV